MNSDADRGCVVHNRFSKVIVFFLLLSFPISKLFADVCLPQNMDKWFSISPFIFKGKVVKKNGLQYLIKITDLYKGDLKKYVSVSGDFELDKEYFVLANYDRKGSLFAYFGCGMDASYLIASPAERVDGDIYDARLNENILAYNYTYVARAGAYRDAYKVIMWNKLVREKGKDASYALMEYTKKADYSMGLKVYSTFKDVLLDDNNSARVAKNKSIFVYLLALTGQVDEALENAALNFKAYPDDAIVQQHYAWALAMNGKIKEVPKKIMSYAALSIREENGFNFSKTNLDDLEFKQSVLFKVSFNSSKIDDLKFDGSETSLLNFSHSVIEDLDYKFVDSYDDVFVGARIIDFDVRASKLDGVKFNNSKIVMNARNSQFVGVSFKGAVFDGSEFSSVNFSEVSLAGVSFKASNLSGIYTFDENGIDFSSVLFDEKTIWPNNFDLKSMRLLPIDSKNLLEEENESSRYRYSRRSDGYWLAY